MLTATKNNVLVCIDKKAQLEKQSKTKSGIIIPDAYKYMEYNLQYGRILSIGIVAHQQFPEMEVGDTCIFHHTIEDGRDQLVDVLPNGDEVRYCDGRNNPKLRNFQIFGVLKPEGFIIPSPWFIFLDTKIKKQNKVNLDKSGLHVDQEMWDDEKLVHSRIAELAEQKKQLQQGFEHLKNSSGQLKDSEARALEPTVDAISSIEKEQHMLTRALNRNNLYTGVVQHIHEATAHKISVMPHNRVTFDKRTLYPIEFLGNSYYLLQQDHVWVVEEVKETENAYL